MLKIMIVDDEVLSRIALRSMVESRYNVVAEATNGVEGIELAQKTMPDIILVDVIMPGMDGLGFISQISKMLPLTKYIIISNVEQIEYLKKAIKMNVHDYLIKGTLTEETLLSTLSELSKRILRERQTMRPVSEEKQPVYSEAVLAELVDGVIRGERHEESEITQIFRNYGMELCDDPYYCLFFRGSGSNIRSVSDRILVLGREILNDCGTGLMLKRSYCEFVCFYIPPRGGDAEKAVRDLAYRCLMTNQNVFGVQFVAGISQPAVGGAALQRAFLQAHSASREDFYGKDNTKIFWYSRPEKTGETAAAQLKMRVKSIIQNRTVDALLKTPALLEELRTAAETAGTIPRETILGLYMDVVCFAANFARDVGVAVFDDLGDALVALTSAGKFDELHQGSLAVVQLALQYYGEAKGGSSDIKQIKQYITDHIAEELRMEEIAAHVHVSPNYLSQMFKNETGINLRDYIAAERIRRAKDYLLLGKSLRETALLTGFSTDSYFVQKFKAAVHMTPKQFQKQNKV